MKIKTILTIGAMSLLLAGSSVYAQTAAPQTYKDTGAKRAAEVKKVAETRQAMVKKTVEAKKVEIRKRTETKKATVKKKIETKKAEKKADNAVQPVATSTSNQ